MARDEDESTSQSSSVGEASILLGGGAQQQRVSPPLEGSGSARPTSPTSELLEEITNQAEATFALVLDVKSPGLVDQE